MFLANKIVWAGIVFTFRTTGISGPRPTRRASRSILSEEKLAAAQKSDVKHMQQSLRDKGHYRDKGDGIIGPRTRASIRAYQQAENLPVTGELDSQTAGKLGAGPESSGVSFRNAARKVGEGIDTAGHEIIQSKPSAGIKWAKGRRASKKPRKEVSRATGPESDRGKLDNKQQARNKKRFQ
jgi:peptidoglycan hydrolase-like protein with peptidoglycan-binding domain